MEPNPEYLDIETVFREGARKSLESVYPPNPGVPVRGIEVLSGTQKAVDEFLGRTIPNYASLEEMLEWEKSTKKPRKGVMESLQKAMNARTADPIPNKTKMLPECCQIIAIGHGPIGGEEVVTGSESYMLEWAWDRIEKDYLANGVGPYGWRLASFDIPVMLAASAIHEVPVPECVRIHTKYSHSGFFDMALRWHGDGKLRDVCLATGFDRDVDDPLGTGANVSVAWEEGRRDDIVAHCQVDLLRNAHMHQLYKGILW